MNRWTIYTYKGIKEFNILLEKCDKEDILFTHFKFKDTLELLEENENVIIDITNIMPFVRNDNANVYSVELNLHKITSETKVVVDEKYAEYVLDLLRNVFDKKVCLNLLENREESIQDRLAINRKTIYTYNNLSELNKVIEYCKQKQIIFISFSKINNESIEKIKENKIKILIDITSIVLANEHTPETIYMFEQLLNNFENYDAIVRRDLKEKVLENYPFTFECDEEVNKLFPNIKVDNSCDMEYEENNNTTIVNIDEQKLILMKNAIKEGLFGHDKFKEDFSNKIDNFVILNKLNRKKVLSVFLLGGTGLGKTEVARIIARNLNSTNDNFIKINFGNYSSQDALNSLIGSPKGYVGCESGELSMKLSKNKIGLILCDEFEKANKTIFNFFLELLEDGKFTDSMSNEHDLDGFLIIFTSNISKKEFCQQIPSEFQSRVDCVYEFVPLRTDEKKKYAVKYVEDLIRDLKENDVNITLSPAEYLEVVDIDYESINNIRDIKRNLDEKIFEKIKHMNN